MKYPLKGYAVLTIFLGLLAGSVFLWQKERAGNSSNEALGLTPERIEKAKLALADCDKVRKQDPQLFKAVSAVMFKLDPMGINYQTNTDEYDPEVGLLIPQLKKCSSPDDVAGALFEIFKSQFDADMAGKRERYDGLAKEIWKIWKKL